MSNLIPGNHKHVTLEDRQFIEESLNSQRSFCDHDRNEQAGTGIFYCNSMQNCQKGGIENVHTMLWTIRNIRVICWK